MEPRSLSHAARVKNSQLKRNSAETWLKGRDVEAARESSSRDADSDEEDSVPVEESRMEQCVFPSRSPHPCFDPFVHETASLHCVRPLLFETRDALHLRGVPDLRRTAPRSSRKVERDGPRETAPRFRSGPPSRRGRGESTGEEDGMASKANRKRGCVSLQSQRGRKVGKSRRQVRRNLLRRLKRSRRGGNELHNPPTQKAQGDVNRGSGSARAVLFTLDQVGCDVDAREQLLPRREREKPSFHGEAATTSREALNGEKNDAPRPSKVRCKKRRASRTHDKERRGKRRREPNGKGSEKKEAEEREREDRPGFRRKGLPRQLSGPPPLRRSVHGTSREEVLTFRRPMERFSRSRRSVELEKRREEAVRSRKKRRFPGRESPETELKTLSLSGKRPPTAAAVFQVYYRFTCRAHTGSRRFSVPVSAPSPSFFSSEMLVTDHLTLVICAYSVPSLNQELFRLTAEGAAVRSMSLDGIWQVSTQHRQTDRHTQYMYLLLGLQRSKPRMQQGVVVAEEGRGDCK
ncbi:hypothetical protein TGMAS_363580 [Toxoplasma gondii MAS]|uniref:Uncharacterized protein n=1 Tax=Toxoplasma gondii MAS TaxID=943118 RepID=A0A086QCB0_TOXGO|nr:hypothetical protein TGMAS_363580 [Toxoplasma gondii MAS]